MGLRFGGGALQLSTEEFENGEPSGLRVKGFLGFEVLDPIPPIEPEPNNVSGLIFSKERFFFNQDFGIEDIEVSSIQFKNSSLYGINLAEDLPSIYRRVATRQDFIFFNVSDPIPQPDPGPNNIAYISFQKSAAYGFRVLSALPQRSQNLFFRDSAALYIRSLKALRTFVNGNQTPMQIRIWTGTEWKTPTFRVWVGDKWA
jgi:hypothetical protein